jgi:Fe-S cluster assembly iron-binding protein IscA
MIEVTQRAKEELKGLLTSNVDHPEACLRLRTNEEGRLGFGIDIEMPGDQVVEYEGSKLLVVEAELANSLENMAIDVEDSDEGGRLVIVNNSQ